MSFLHQLMLPNLAEPGVQETAGLRQVACRLLAPKKSGAVLTGQSKSRLKPGGNFLITRLNWSPDHRKSRDLSGFSEKLYTNGG